MDAKVGSVKSDTSDLIEPGSMTTGEVRSSVERFPGGVALRVIDRSHPLHCEHVSDHLPGYGKRRSILVPSLSLALSGSQLRGLHQRLLNVLVPLFGDGRSNQLVR